MHRRWKVRIVMRLARRRRFAASRRLLKILICPESLLGTFGLCFVPIVNWGSNGSGSRQDFRDPYTVPAKTPGEFRDPQCNS